METRANRKVRSSSSIRTLNDEGPVPNRCRVIMIIPCETGYVCSSYTGIALRSASTSCIHMDIHLNTVIA